LPLGSQTPILSMPGIELKKVVFTTNVSKEKVNWSYKLESILRK
jgi:hypothetical protein